MTIEKIEKRCQTCGEQMYIDLNMNMEFCLECLKNTIERGVIIWVSQ